jgi:hypothetical protein
VQQDHSVRLRYRTTIASAPHFWSYRVIASDPIVRAKGRNPRTEIAGGIDCIACHTAEGKTDTPEEARDQNGDLTRDSRHRRNRTSLHARRASPSLHPNRRISMTWFHARQRFVTCILASMILRKNSTFRTEEQKYRHQDCVSCTLPRVIICITNAM